VSSQLQTYVPNKTIASPIDIYHVPPCAFVRNANSGFGAAFSDSVKPQGDNSMLQIYYNNMSCVVSGLPVPIVAITAGISYHHYAEDDVYVTAKLQ